MKDINSMKQLSKCATKCSFVILIIAEVLLAIAIVLDPKNVSNWSHAITAVAMVALPISLIIKIITETCLESKIKALECKDKFLSETGDMNAMIDRIQEGKER